MIQRRICFLLMFMLFLWSANPASTTTLAKDFFTGIEHYKNQNYTAAIEVFSHLAESGVNNGKLFYNLGNAYLKNNDLGHAILWYERALKLMPNDPDIRFNYEYALSQIKDEREDQTFPIFKVLFFWKFLLEASSVKWIAILLNFLFWMLITLNIWSKRRTLRTTTFLTLVLMVIFTSTAFYNFYENLYIRQAIILPAQVWVRSGLTDEATGLFILHAGTKVNIQKELKEYYRISFSEGKIGWIKQSDAGII